MGLFLPALPFSVKLKCTLRLSVMEIHATTLPSPPDEGAANQILSIRIDRDRDTRENDITLRLSHSARYHFQQVISPDSAVLELV